MIILAIETSCDETAVAILEDGKTILSEVVATQIKWHAKYGGVVPEQASRMHSEKLHFLIQDCLEAAGLSATELSAIAVTYGPGLEGALLVGVSVAQTMASLLGIPLIPVNHLHGHIYASFLAEPELKFPFVTLLVSGGHTQLLHVKDHFDAQLLGETRDDACGEAFDKVARVCGLSYPGGPVVEEKAKSGDAHAFDFPIPMRGRGLEFSFSGLKTAVAQEVYALENVGELPIPDLCASFQRAVSQSLSEKCSRACQETGVSTLVISGGVASNAYIREHLESISEKTGISLVLTPRKYCTDNAVMIGIAAWHQFQASKILESAQKLRVAPNLSVEEGIWT